MAESLFSLSTPWSLIQAAQGSDAPPEARRHCLELLARRYREPLFAYLAVFGVADPHDRDDVIQAFFLRFLERGDLDRLDPQKGSFRQFLLIGLRNFLADEHRRGGRRHAASPFTRSGDTGGAFPEDLTGSATGEPETRFNQAWARRLVEDAVAAFEAECHEKKLQHYFAVFERHDLRPEAFGHPTYTDTAAAQSCSVDDVKNHLKRARRAFAKTLRALVRKTVATDEEVENELAQLERYFR